MSLIGMRSSTMGKLLANSLKLTLLLCLSTAVSAQNDFFNTIDIASHDSPDIGDNSIIGWITQKVSQGLENPRGSFSRQHSGLNKIETSLFAQLDSSINEDTRFRISGKAYHDEIYRFDDDNVYSEDEINEFRNRFEVKDFYIEHQNDNGLYMKLGNQILAWGMSEYLRVTDLINTEDQYTFAQQDLEDIRLQVPAALFSFSVNEWLLDWVFTYRAGRNDLAPSGDEFDPFLGRRNAGLLIQREDTDNDMEGFFRASSHWSRGDLQFVAGEFNDNILSLTSLEALDSPQPIARFQQQRMRAIGFSGNLVEGSWLLFAEVGLHQDKTVRPNANSFHREVNGWDEKDQTLAIAGAEYAGFRNLLLSFEIDSIHTRDHDEFMYGDENQLSFGSRIYWTALNERLQLLAVWNKLANDDGNVARVSVDYNWSDQLELGMLWVAYDNPADSIFYDYRNNDVFQLQLRYNFQL